MTRHFFRCWTVLFSAVCLFAGTSHAATYSLPQGGSNIVGEIRYVGSQPGETLGEIGRRYDIGFYEMVEANPQVDPNRIIRSYTQIKLPTRYILPPVPRRGIVINLAELRLYYYPPGSHMVITEPVGIGRQGWETPLGTTKIIEKIPNPAWHPTESVRRDAKRLGFPLPKRVPPGPDNPLGKYAMRMGWYSYLIHGTNKPQGVGRRSSAGCIRMFPEDIELLFSQVKIGTPVRVINLPFKLGWQDQQLFLEAHKPLQEQSYRNAIMTMMQTIHRITKNKPVLVDWQQVKQTVEQQNGIPTMVGQRTARLGAVEQTILPPETIF